MAEMITMLAVVGEVLAALAVSMTSATADEVPALATEAKTLVARMVACCLDTAPLEHLAQEEAETLRAELVRLGEVLQLEIASIIDLRWAQLSGGRGSWTQH
jgi:hypothetical protein